jgi:dTMP kinase
MPDVTVLLDVPADIGLARQASEERAYDRLEAEALEFHERVRDSYLAIAQENPDRVVVIDGTAAIDEVHRAVLERVSQALD